MCHRALRLLAAPASVSIAQGSSRDEHNLRDAGGRIYRKCCTVGFGPAERCYCWLCGRNGIGNAGADVDREWNGCGWRPGDCDDQRDFWHVGRVDYRRADRDGGAWIHVQRAGHYRHSRGYFGKHFDDFRFANQRIYRNGGSELLDQSRGGQRSGELRTFAGFSDFHRLRGTNVGADGFDDRGYYG